MKPISWQSLSCTENKLAYNVLIMHALDSRTRMGGGESKKAKGVLRAILHGR